jgi:nucleoid DNA-binding protein
VTQGEMEHEIVRRTGLPASVVKLVFATLKDVISESLSRQSDVVFRGLFRITSTVREFSSFSTPVGAELPQRQTSYKLVLGIHPIRAFRQELNRWTSSP